MAKLLNKETIQKMAAYILERHKESAVAPSVTMGGDLGGMDPRSTFSISPSTANPMGETSAYEKMKKTVGLKPASGKGGTPRVPKV